jgi:hypothetical protein
MNRLKQQLQYSRFLSDNVCVGSDSVIRKCYPLFRGIIMEAEDYIIGVLPAWIVQSSYDK